MLNIKVASWVKWGGGGGTGRVSQAEMVRNAEKFLYNLWERKIQIIFEASTVWML